MTICWEFRADQRTSAAVRYSFAYGLKTETCQFSKTFLVSPTVKERINILSEYRLSTVSIVSKYGLDWSAIRFPELPILAFRVFLAFFVLRFSLPLCVFLQGFQGFCRAMLWPPRNLVSRGRRRRKIARLRRLAAMVAASFL